MPHKTWPTYQNTVHRKCKFSVPTHIDFMGLYWSLKQNKFSLLQLWKPEAWNQCPKGFVPSKVQGAGGGAHFHVFPSYHDYSHVLVCGCETLRVLVVFLMCLCLICFSCDSSVAQDHFDRDIPQIYLLRPHLSMQGHIHRFHGYVNTLF